MNIVVIFTFEVSLFNWKKSGILKRELEIYKKIEAEKKFNYIFITYGDKLDYKIAAEENINIIPIYEIYKKSKFKIINFLKSFFIPFKIKKLISTPDIIKTNQLNGSWVGIILKYLTRSSLIIRTGYNIHDFKKRQKKPFLIIFFYFVLTKISYLAADLFLVTSKTDFKNISKITSSSKKIKIVPNYILSNFDLILPDRLNNCVLSVGRLEEQKNFDKLISAFQNTEYRIDIVGIGTMKESLLMQAKNLDVNLNLLGSIEHKNLLNLYKKYKYFILLSKYEGNSKVILEALAAGCVVICSDNENNRDVITNNKNGILIQSINQIMEVIEKIENNSEFYSQLVDEGKKFIQNFHSIEKILNLEINNYKYLTKN